MDRVRHELERSAGQALPVGAGQLRGGVQQQGGLHCVAGSGVVSPLVSHLTGFLAEQL